MWLTGNYPIESRGKQFNMFLFANKDIETYKKIVYNIKKKVVTLLVKTRKSYPKKDLTGMKFSMLTPVEWLRGGKWKCICDCGNETIVDTRNIMNGHTKSCGCMNYSTKNLYDMTNYENENLKVISRADNIGEIAAWNCICKRCGNMFTTKGSNIRNGDTKSCGCIHSFNEQIITELLIKNKIEFSTQYTFPDLIGVGGRPLKFDFAIFKKGKLERLVEFNGLQHYEKPNGSWADGFETLVEHDKRKMEYCKENGIELKVIKYSEDYDLNDILN